VRRLSTARCIIVIVYQLLVSVMTEQVASDRSLSSRLVFLVAGAATGIAMSQAGVGGIWLAVGAVASSSCSVSSIFGS